MSDAAVLNKLVLKTESNLEGLYAAGHFVVTSELGPPKSCSSQELVHAAAELKDYCDGFNITDNQTSIVLLSSIAAGVHVIAGGPRAAGGYPLYK
jgi:methylenetetrahydrofolate reductase (NADPH)